MLSNRNFSVDVYRLQQATVFIRDREIEATKHLVAERPVDSRGVVHVLAHAVCHPATVTHRAMILLELYPSRDVPKLIPQITRLRRQFHQFTM